MLQDDNKAVRQAVVRQLPETLKLFIMPNGAAVDARAGSDLAQALVNLHSGLGLDWRCQENLMLALPALAQVAMPESQL